MYISELSEIEPQWSKDLMLSLENFRTKVFTVCTPNMAKEINYKICDIQAIIHSNWI